MAESSPDPWSFDARIAAPKVNDPMPEMVYIKVDWIQFNNLRLQAFFDDTLPCEVFVNLMIDNPLISRIIISKPYHSHWQQVFSIAYGEVKKLRKNEIVWTLEGGINERTNKD